MSFEDRLPVFALRQVHSLCASLFSSVKRVVLLPQLRELNDKVHK